MSNIPAELKYTKEHEWIKVDGDTAVIGITEHAQSELGDVVFVEMPGIGDKLSQGDEFGVVESVKTVSNLYSPVSGEVTAINEALEDDPELINKEPYSEGWIIKIQVEDASDLDKLLSAADYAKELE